MPTSEKKKPPEKKISPVNSGVTVSIWLNEVQTDNGTRYFRSITIEPQPRSRSTGRPRMSSIVEISSNGRS